MTFDPQRHLDDDTFERLACDELDAREHELVLQHLRGCSDCERIYRAVALVRQEAVAFDPGAPAPTLPEAPRSPRERDRGAFAAPAEDSTPPPELERKAPSRRPWWAAAAAAAVVALVLWLPRPPEPVVVRSVDSTELRLLTPAEGEVTTRPRFTWQPLANASGYTVELLDAEGELIWESNRQQDPTALWPTGVEARPGLYYWRVRAHFPDAVETSASPLLAFEVTTPEGP